MPFNDRLIATEIGETTQQVVPIRSVQALTQILYILWTNAKPEEHGTLLGDYLVAKKSLLDMTNAQWILAELPNKQEWANSFQNLQRILQIALADRNSESDTQLRSYCSAILRHISSVASSDTPAK